MNDLPEGRKRLKVVHRQILIIWTTLATHSLNRAFFIIYLSDWSRPLNQPATNQKKIIIIFEPDVNFHKRVNLCFWSFSRRFCCSARVGRVERGLSKRRKEGVQFSLLLFGQFSVFYGRQWLIRIDRVRREWVDTGGAGVGGGGGIGLLLCWLWKRLVGRYVLPYCIFSFERR